MRGAVHGTDEPGEGYMTDAQARAHIWTLCLAALILCALTGPVAALLTPLAHASAPTLHVVAAVLAAVLVGAYVALAALLIVAVLRVVRPRLHGRH
jgi:predicted membrane protein